MEALIVGPLSRRDIALAPKGALLIAVNRGLWLAPQCRNYVSYHSQNLSEILAGWRGHAFVQRGVPPIEGVTITMTDNIFSGGSSALFAVSVALNHFRATKVYLSGIALSHEGYSRYRDCWRNHAERLRRDCVSLTPGWLKDFLEGKVR